MTDEPKSLPPPYNQDPERYGLYASGAIYDRQNGKKIVANPGGGKYAITPDNARAMLQRRREIGLIAQMRGLALAEGIELPDDAELEQLAQAAGNSLTALTAHMAKTFKESKNLRGMGETFSRLAAGFLDTDKVQIELGKPSEQQPIMFLIAQYISTLREDPDLSNAVEGEISET